MVLSMTLTPDMRLLTNARKKQVELTEEELFPHGGFPIILST